MKPESWRDVLASGKRTSAPMPGMAAEFQKEELMETLDDSKMGINLLIKSSLKVTKVSAIPGAMEKSVNLDLEMEEETEKQRTILDFKAILQKAETMKHNDNTNDSASGSGTRVKLDRGDFSTSVASSFWMNRRRAINKDHSEAEVVAYEEGTENEIVLIDEASKKRPGVTMSSYEEVIEECTDSKKPKMIDSSEGISANQTKALQDLLKNLKYKKIDNWAADSDDSNTGFSIAAASQNFSKLSQVRECAKLAVSEPSNDVAIPENDECEIDFSRRVTPKPEKAKSELTEERIAYRQEQIDLAKAADGYKNYRTFHPKQLDLPGEVNVIGENATIAVSGPILDKYGDPISVRKDSDKVEVFPTTPKKNDDVSKRQWDVKMRRWKRSLHLFDDCRTLEQFKRITGHDDIPKPVRKLPGRRKGAPVRNGFLHTPIFDRPPKLSES